MGEIVTLTDDIDGPSVPADERVRFGVDGKDYEIDLTDEHAAKLRDVFAGLTDTVRVRARIDGRNIDAMLPEPLAEEFKRAIAEWTEHARKAGTAAPRIKRDAPRPDKLQGPVIEPGKRYWQTPEHIGHGTRAAQPWEALRADMKQWGEPHGYKVGVRGAISDALGLNFALATQGKSFEFGPQYVPPTDDKAPETTTSRTKATTK